jgi:hypothetical protein
MLMREDGSGTEKRDTIKKAESFPRYSLSVLIKKTVNTQQFVYYLTMRHHPPLPPGHVCVLPTPGKNILIVRQL